MEYQSSISSKLLKELEKFPYTLNNFSTEIINRFIGHIYSYETPEILIDIGTIKAYERANEEKWKWVLNSIFS